jgi:hypothetical protein
MKKVLLVCLIICLSTPLFALGPLKIGLYGGFWGPTDSLYKKSAAFGGSLSFDFIKYLAVEIVGFSNNFNVTGSEIGLSKGRLERFPVLFGLRGQYPFLDGKLTPFVSIGVGIGKPKFNIDSSVAAPWENVGIAIEENVEDKTLIHIGGGVEYRIIKLLAIGLDARYLPSKNGGTWSQKDVKSGIMLSGNLEELDFGGILLGLTIKIVI